MKEIFKLKEPTYNLRSDSSHFMQRKIKTTSYGLQPLEYLAPKISDLVPQDIKNCKTVNAFKSQKKILVSKSVSKSMKNTHPNQCPNQ